MVRWYMLERWTERQCVIFSPPPEGLHGQHSEIDREEQSPRRSIFLMLHNPTLLLYARHVVKDVYFIKDPETAVHHNRDLLSESLAIVSARRIYHPPYQLSHVRNILWLAVASHVRYRLQRGVLGPKLEEEPFTFLLCTCHVSVGGSVHYCRGCAVSCCDTPVFVMLQLVLLQLLSIVNISIL